MTRIQTIMEESKGIEGELGLELETDQFLVDDVALEFLVPPVVEALGLNEIADVDVTELRGVSKQRTRRRLPRTWRARYQDVRPRSVAVAAAAAIHRRIQLTKRLDMVDAVKVRRGR
ncbi:hypothetical protein KSP40_PGU013097 [Platanthera guangdongensis]|uniref:Carrier domain-containing protein n=1 Tax=Platanthera guangdongensis TaxID=2320717 RepID=A0ABR2MUZ0_9ASPA